MASKNKTNSDKTIKVSYLSQEQQDYLARRKVTKDIRSQEAAYNKEKRLERSEQPIRKIGSFLQTKQNQTFKRIDVKVPKQTLKFRPTPIPQVISREQSMLQELFGQQNQSWGTGNNLPKLNRTLTSGSGIIKNGDEGDTGRMFGMRRRQ